MGNASPREESMNPKGTSPILDSFRATVCLAKVGWPSALTSWRTAFGVVPSFVCFVGRHSLPGFYRANGCHELIAMPPFPGMTNRPLLHMAYGQFDFTVDLLSDEPLEDMPLCAPYPAVVGFAQSRDRVVAPKGGEINGLGESKAMLRLFHHTTRAAKRSILKDKKLRGSHFNFPPVSG